MPPVQSEKLKVLGNREQSMEDRGWQKDKGIFELKTLVLATRARLPRHRNRNEQRMLLVHSIRWRVATRHNWSPYRINRNNSVGWPTMILWVAEFIYSCYLSSRKLDLIKTALTEEK